MKRKLVTMTAAALLTTSAVLAQPATTDTTTTTTTTTTVHVWNDPNVWWGNHWTHISENQYSGEEFSMDFFGSYLANQRKIEDLFKTNIRSGHWGGGVGANYFFIKELGIMGDINIPDNGGKFVDSINGGLVARLPICDSGFAPYIFGGGGRQTQPAWKWMGFAGVGMEYRFNPGTGIFIDSRYNWVKTTPDTIEFRAGLRFVF